MQLIKSVNVFTRTQEAGLPTVVGKRITDKEREETRTQPVVADRLASARQTQKWEEAAAGATPKGHEHRPSAPSLH